jgi:phosphoribosylformylglycinamidine synthase
MAGTIEDATSFGLTDENFKDLTTAIGKEPSKIELELVSNILSTKGCLNGAISSLSKLPSLKDLDTLCLDGDLIPVLGKSSSNEIANTLSVNAGLTSETDVKKTVSKLVKDKKAAADKSSLNFDALLGSKTILSKSSLSLVSKKDFKTNNVSLSMNGELIELPTDLLVKSSKGSKSAAPKRITDVEKFDIESIEEPKDLREVAMALLTNENLVNDNVLLKNDLLTDAAVVSMKNSDASLMLSVNSNPRYFYANPMMGVAISMVQASRDIVLSGGRPLMITNELEVLNKESDELTWQFTETMEGLKKISTSLKTPITSNHITFNENTEAGLASLVSTIGMVGVLDKGKSLMTSNFKNKGDLIFILGQSVDCIASSEYLSACHKINTSAAPHLNLDQEIELQGDVASLIEKELVNAAHGIGKGGLYLALTKMGLKNELGFDIVTDSEVREDAFLFGEGQARALVTVNEDQEDDFIEFMMAAGTQFTLLGHVTKGKTVVDDVHFGFMNEAKDLYENAFENAVLA